MPSDIADRDARTPHAAVAPRAWRVPDPRRAAAARRSDRRHPALGKQRHGSKVIRPTCRRRRSWTDGWQLGQPDAVLTPARAVPRGPRQRGRLSQSGDSHAAHLRRVRARRGVQDRRRADSPRGDPRRSERRRRGAATARTASRASTGCRGRTSRIPTATSSAGRRAAGRSSRPTGMPWRLDRGADLVIEVHVMPSKTPVTIQPTVGAVPHRRAARADAADRQDGLEADRHSGRASATTWSPTPTSCRCRSIC